MPRNFSQFRQPPLQEGNWQAAIDAYKQAISAVELSRSWSQDDDRRQEILKDAIGVYANTVQCFINLQQYAQAFEYAERSRSRQLVDLMASKDLYHQGEIPPEVEELLQQFDSLEREIHNLRFPNQSPDKGEMKMPHPLPANAPPGKPATKRLPN